MSAQPGLVHDGYYKVTWVDAIANQDAPTVTELTAGIDLECQITPDGLAREAEDESVDTSRLCSVFSTAQVGRTSFELSLTLVRLDEANLSGGATEDEAYRTLTKGKPELTDLVTAPGFDRTEVLKLVAANPDMVVIGASGTPGARSAANSLRRTGTTCSPRMSSCSSTVLSGSPAWSIRNS